MHRYSELFGTLTGIYPPSDTNNLLLCYVCGRKCPAMILRTLSTVHMRKWLKFSPCSGEVMRVWSVHCDITCGRGYRWKKNFTQERLVKWCVCVNRAICKNVKQFTRINHFVLSMCKQIVRKHKKWDHQTILIACNGLWTDCYVKDSGWFFQENSKDVSTVYWPHPLYSSRVINQSSTEGGGGQNETKGEW